MSRVFIGITLVHLGRKGTDNVLSWDIHRIFGHGSRSFLPWDEPNLIGNHSPFTVRFQNPRAFAAPVTVVTHIRVHVGELIAFFEDIAHDGEFHIRRTTFAKALQEGFNLRSFREHVVSVFLLALEAHHTDLDS